MKSETDDIYVIFLLKKNVQTDIIKIILGYLLIIVPEMLREWKIAIILVEQEYESTESQKDYKIRIRMTYGERGVPMNIGKARENFNENRRPKCFNCNAYRYMEKKYWKLKKEWDTRNCYKCNKVGYITKDCRTGLKMKNSSI